MVDTQSYVVLGVQHRDSIMSLYVMFTSVAMISHHTSLFRIIYYPYAMPIVPTPYSFHNWKPVPPTLLHPLCPFPPPPSSGNHQFILHIYRSGSLFIYSFYFLDITYE